VEGGCWIVVPLWSPMRWVLVVKKVEVDVDVEVVVEGRTTVNWPDGVPVATCLVTVRVNVIVTVTMVVHMGGASIALGVGVGSVSMLERRCEHADVTYLGLYSLRSTMRLIGWVNLTIGPSLGR
jgi:hypothetical protein